jgi:hypothetical protein
MVLSSHDDQSEYLKVISDERTSRFIYLSKCQDLTVRNVERKAAEFIGVSSTTVEPLQVTIATFCLYLSFFYLN